MILMALAIVCGLGASYMTSRLLAERSISEEEKVKVLVCKRALSVGERLAKPEEIFEYKEVTRENEPPDAIKDIEALKNKTMKQSRNKGDHVTLANLLVEGGLDIPEGHQAVGLPVNLATTAHGLASLPGSRVDLILTVRQGQGGASDVIALTVLENVLVLAADARTNREGEIIAPASVVTFALKEKEKLTMIAAKDMGVLSLSLRKFHDDTKGEITRISGAEILKKNKKEEAPAIAHAPPVVKDPPSAQKTETVEAPPVPAEKFSLNTLTIVSGERIQATTLKRYENGDVEDVSANPHQPAPRPRTTTQPTPPRGSPQSPQAPREPSRDF